MKLRNKKTGEIAEVLTDSIAVNILMDQHDITAYYTSLAELNEEWEDYEKPKEYWYIDADGGLLCEPSDDRCKFDNKCREIGNHFETKEEAEQAVERLKKLQNLKNRGYNIDAYIDMIIERGEEDE